MYKTNLRIFSEFQSLKILLLMPIKNTALKVSRRTLQDYINNGIFPYRVLGGKILYQEVIESGY